MIVHEFLDYRGGVLEQIVCYYITGFGFGHLTRSLAIIAQLLTLRDDVKIIIKADTQLFAKVQQYLAAYEGRLFLQPFVSHFSIFFDPATFCVDMQATGEDALRWIKGLPASAQREAEFLHDHRVALVLSEIVPEALEAAALTGIPGVGISNFTWYEICADVLGQDERLRPLYDMYRAAGEMLLFPFSTGDLIPMERKTDVGPITRSFDQGRIRQIRDRHKKENRPLAFLSVGGATRVADFPLREDMDYLVTIGVEVQGGPNVHRLPPEMSDSHNYLAACDLVITKCGWSTVAEATLAEVPLWLMLSQNGWLEERCVHREVMSLGIGRDRTFADMNAMTCDGIITELAHLKSAYTTIPRRYQNGMARIMEIVQQSLAAGGR